MFAFEEFVAFFKFVDKGDIVYQVGETKCLAVTAFHEITALAVADGFFAEKDFEITADGAHGGFEFVGNVVGHFLLQLAVALLLDDNLVLGGFGFGAQLLFATDLAFETDGHPHAGGEGGYQ